MQDNLSYACTIGLLASVLVAPTANAQEASDSPRQKTVIEAAAGVEAFSIFVAAIKTADLAESLGGEGPFTIFAPTNRAFESLPKGTVANLLKPENREKLQAVLKNHVIPGKVMAAELEKLDSITTLQGQVASVTTSDAGVMIEKAKVMKTDTVGGNGVIHVVNHVILPE